MDTVKVSFPSHDYNFARWKVIIKTAARESRIEVTEAFIEQLYTSIQDETKAAERFGVEKLRRVIDPWRVLEDGLQLQADFMKSDVALQHGYIADSDRAYHRGKQHGFTMAVIHYIDRFLAAYR